MSLKFFLNSGDFGIFPVPIAHLGSYAKIILLIFFIFFNAFVICLLSTERVLLFFFLCKFLQCKESLLVFP